MNIPCRGKSHLFIGLVDKSKYRIENLGKIFFKFFKFQLFGKIHQILFTGMFGILN